MSTKQQTHDAGVGLLFARLADVLDAQEAVCVKEIELERHRSSRVCRGVVA